MNAIPNKLTADNIDDAEFNPEIDPVDTLKRIGKEWLANHVKCQCPPGIACPTCEIEYLLNEALRLPVS